MDIRLKVDPTINFTMSHTSIEGKKISDKCECIKKSLVPFLDVSCKIKDGQLEKDLDCKEMDKNQYLLMPSQTDYKLYPF